MEGRNGNYLDLDAMDFDYFNKDTEVSRKVLHLDDESISILKEITDDDNPFDIDFDFDMNDLSGSKLVRASIKVIKENPELLILLDREIGVENL